MLLQSLKNLYHLLNAILANFYYSFPSRKLYVIGVTGTNGKTTTVQMIAQILERAGYKIAVSSTINFWLGPKKWTNKTKFTTENSWKLQKFLARAQRTDCQFAVIETSSHALSQNRVWGVDFDIGVLTNITREHLDYHRSIPQYRQAKLKLFRYLAKKSRRAPVTKNGFSSAFSVINLDMKNPRQFLLGNPDYIYGYQIKKQKTSSKIKNLIRPRKIKLNFWNSSFYLNKVPYKLQLPGLFNVENALAAIAAARILKIKERTIKEALQTLAGIPGRLEKVPNQKGIEIIIDYALTPDSMEKIGKLFRNKINRHYRKTGQRNKLFWVFGSCGERDRGKRPLMGKIAAQYADTVIITNEDPYHEDPNQIINEIFLGVLESPPSRKTMPSSKIEGQNVFRILDRQQAIKKALNSAKRGDTILLTGKGAEENMKIGDNLIPWNDKKAVKKALKRLNKAQNHD